MNELRRSHSLLQEIQARTRAIQLDATDTRVRLGDLATIHDAEKADGQQQATPPLNEALPDDGLLHVCRCLSATDLLHLGQCCKALHLLVKQNGAGWAELCHQRFGCSTDLSCVPRMRWEQGCWTVQEAAREDPCSWHDVFMEHSIGWQVAQTTLAWLQRHSFPAAVSGVAHRQQLMFALQSLQVLFSGAPEAAAVFKRHCLSNYSIEQAVVSLLSNSSPVFQELALLVISALLYQCQEAVAAIADATNRGRLLWKLQVLRRAHPRCWLHVWVNLQFGCQAPQAAPQQIRPSGQACTAGANLWQATPVTKRIVAVSIDAAAKVAEAVVDIALHDGHICGTLSNLPGCCQKSQETPGDGSWSITGSIQGSSCLLTMRHAVHPEVGSISGFFDQQGMFGLLAVNEHQAPMACRIL